MRAVLTAGFGAADVLYLGEAPPPAPRAGELLVKVVASGVNRADILQRRGLYPPPPGASDLLGLEVSGHVAALGDGVKGWTVGDPCLALLTGGGYAEFVAVPAGQVVPPPPGIDLITAAGVLEVAATVVSNIPPQLLGSGRVLLVHGGAGGIGTFAIQYGAALGARVIATAGTAEKLRLCTELGASLALDYHDEWVEGVRETTDGRGADVVLDVIGAAYLSSNVDVLAVDGLLVVIGLQGGRKGTLDLAALLAKRATITATSLRQRPADQKAAICRSVRDQVWPMFAAGRISHAPQTLFSAADAAAAHNHLDSGRNVGKVILTW